jgi:hypothetical protein
MRDGRLPDAAAASQRHCRGVTAVGRRHTPALLATTAANMSAEGMTHARPISRPITLCESSILSVWLGATRKQHQRGSGEPGALRERGIP